MSDISRAQVQDALEYLRELSVLDEDESSVSHALSTLTTAFQQRDDEIARQGTALATLLLHLQNYAGGVSIKKVQRVGMARAFAIATLAGSPDPMEQVNTDWSDADRKLVTNFEVVSPVKIG